MTYHLFVIRGRERRPRSVGRLTLDASPLLKDVLSDWAQDTLAGVDNVRRWWVVRCASAEQGRELLKKLQELYRPDLPEVPAEIKSNVVLLGR